MQASYRLSERRACGAFPINRSTQRYQSRRLDQAGLKMRIEELAATRVHYGHRRIRVLLRREGWQINHKCTYRLYRELGLQLRNKTPKRKVREKLPDDRTPAKAPNECWLMDFLSDQLFDGRKIRVLSIVDNFTRVSPALGVRTSYCGSDVVETLDRIASVHGRSKRIRLDNGRNSSRRISTCERTNTMWCWTSAGPESRPTMRSRRRSMAGCGPNASTHTGS